MKCMKNNKWNQKGLKSDDVEFEWCILNVEKSWVKICSKNWNPFVTAEFSSETPDTSKEIVQFAHEVHPVFAATLSTF